MSSKPTHQIIDTLTPDAIMARLNVSFHMIRYARTSGVFPANWFNDIDEMCREVGIECPRNIFNWKGSANNVGTARLDCKGPENTQGDAA